MKRSLSDGLGTTPRKTQIPSMPSSGKNPRQHIRILPKPHRPIAQRASSNSQVERLSYYRDPPVTSESFQYDLGPHTQPTVDFLHATRATSLTTKAKWQSNTLAAENSAPAFRWYARVQSISDPDLRTKYLKPAQHGHDAPLKTCLKKKIKIVMPPPSERPESATRTSENKTLRRVKTVDFEEVTKPFHAPAVPGTMSKKMLCTPIRQFSKSCAEASKSKSTARRMPSCLNMMSTVKSTLADPATTRTDVHVIAIATSQNAGDSGGNVGSDPATPTIQFIKSKNGCYEVIWDDVPTESSIDRKCRRSSASHSLKVVGSSATRGLQRVNSKLTDWSGSWNAPSESFKPTILVFPDDDGRSPYYECAVHDNDEYIVSPPPPNSQRTSAVPSRLPSRPPSAPLSKAPSQEEMYVGEPLREAPAEVKHGWIVPLADALVLPELNLQSTRLLNTTHRLRQIPAIRKLSNVEDVDVKFRGHRDSVTLAHSRLMHSGGIAPDLFAHKDSVSVARNHAAARGNPLRTSSDFA
jgi:hypothetical protein